MQILTTSLIGSRVDGRFVVREFDVTTQDPSAPLRRPGSIPQTFAAVASSPSTLGDLVAGASDAVKVGDYERAGYLLWPVVTDPSYQSASPDVLDELARIGGAEDV